MTAAVSSAKQCANTGCTVTGKLQVCGRCRSVSYCSAQCQKAHWKTAHKMACDSLREQCRDQTQLKLDDLKKQNQAQEKELEEAWKKDAAEFMRDPGEFFKWTFRLGLSPKEAVELLQGNPDSGFIKPETREALLKEKALSDKADKTAKRIVKTDKKLNELS